MNESLLICELFKSIQGESTHAGRVCVFVRLSGCNLFCSYCDTSYARYGGKVMSFKALLEQIEAFSCDFVEITGGEPLLQQGTAGFARQLLALGKTVLVETNGSLDIGVLPDECIRIVDVKSPSSGEEHSFLERNISRLHRSDEIKFVLGTKEDFDWALAFIERHNLPDKVTVLFSPVAGKVSPADLAQWILDANAPVRLQLQLHKIIWGDRRGV
ncbi:MAG: radical SAM protein [Chitinispirillaceae bacterium]|nr:radical SAM protein [Chitinispirillaceae bacterium]